MVLFSNRRRAVLFVFLFCLCIGCLLLFHIVLGGDEWCISCSSPPLASASEQQLPQGNWPPARRRRRSDLSPEARSIVDQFESPLMRSHGVQVSHGVITGDLAAFRATTNWQWGPRSAYRPVEPRLEEPHLFYSSATCNIVHANWTNKAEPVSTRVFHSFLYNGEADLLEIKLYELFDVVDVFVVVESKSDFRGRTKPLNFDAADARWSPYVSKIDHFIVEFDVVRASGDQWYAEGQSRYQLNLHLRDLAKEGDIVIAGDLDELPRREVVRLLKNCEVPRHQQPLRLWMPHLYFHLGCLVPDEPWAIMAHWATNASADSAFTVRDAASQKYHHVAGIAETGWHMSWMFRTVREYQHKLSTFSHVEFDTDYYKDPIRIKDIVCGNEALFEKARRCTTRYRNHSLEMPHYLLDHPGKMSYLRPNRCELEKFE